MNKEEIEEKIVELENRRVQPIIKGRSKMYQYLSGQIDAYCDILKACQEQAAATPKVDWDAIEEAFNERYKGVSAYIISSKGEPLAVNVREMCTWVRSQAALSTPQEAAQPSEEHKCNLSASAWRDNNYLCPACYPQAAPSSSPPVSIHDAMNHYPDKVQSSPPIQNNEK